jgi:uncharacterized repeat protein (TIGR03847 family)
MTDSAHEMGRVARLKADAVGQPGSRRFRLLVESQSGQAVVVWMEKEQLFNLGIALKRLIAELEEEGTGRRIEEAPDSNGEDATLPMTEASPEVEFGATRMAVGYDRDTALFIITAYDSDETDLPGNELSLEATQQEVEALADESFEVCAAGRPRCRLCGAPIDTEGHICPKHNGHVRWEEA